MTILASTPRRAAPRQSRSTASRPGPGSWPTSQPWPRRRPRRARRAELPLSRRRGCGLLRRSGGAVRPCERLAAPGPASHRRGQAPLASAGGHCRDADPVPRPRLRIGEHAISVCAKPHWFGGSVATCVPSGGRHPPDPRQRVVVDERQCPFCARRADIVLLLACVSRPQAGSVAVSPANSAWSAGRSTTSAARGRPRDRCRLIGLNNRNLRTLTVAPSTFGCDRSCGRRWWSANRA